MKNIIYILILIFFIITGNSQIVFADDTNNDFGVYINGSESGDFDRYVEKEFTHPVSGKKIYYAGARAQGEGEYYIYVGGKKKIITNGHFRYGPWIKWYGKYLAGINESSANIFSLIFFDLKDNTLSDQYSFILYVDEDKNGVIIAQDGWLELYDIKKNKLLQRFEFKKPLVFDHFDEDLGVDLYYEHRFFWGVLVSSFCSEYDIKKPDKNTLVIIYKIDDEIVEECGEFVYRYDP